MKAILNLAILLVLTSGALLHAQVPPVGPEKCVYNCGSSGSSGALRERRSGNRSERVDYPHVHRDANGRLSPEPGYRWVNPKGRHDFRVEPIPPHYPGMPHESFPNVVYADNGMVRPADGYTWLNEKKGDFRVKPVPRHRPGQAHETLRHVVYGDNEQLFPAEGYTWVDPTKADLGVRPLTARERDARLAAQAIDRGDDLWKQCRYAEAEKEYRQATQRDPQNALAWLSLGATLSRLSRWGAAETALRKAEQIDPNNGQIRRWLALNFLTQANKEADPNLARYYRLLARKDAQEAVELMPNNGFAHQALAQALRAEENYVDAEREYARAVAIEPNNSGFREEYAGLLVDKSVYLIRHDGDPDEVIAAASKALELSGDPLRRAAAYNNIGVVREFQARYAEAEKALSEAIKLDPANEKAKRNLDRVRMTQVKSSASASTTQAPLQPFPAGGTATPPNNGRQSTGAASGGGGSTSPMQQGRVTRRSGVDASISGSSEGAGQTGRVGFDTPGRALPSDDPNVVNVPSSTRPTFSSEVKNNPRMKMLEQQRQELERGREQLQAELDKARAAREKSNSDPNLIKRESDLKAQVLAVETQIHVKEKEYENLGIELSKQTPPTSKKEGPVPRESPK